MDMVLPLLGNCRMPSDAQREPKQMQINERAARLHPDTEAEFPRKPDELHGNPVIPPNPDFAMQPHCTVAEK